MPSYEDVPYAPGPDHIDDLEAMWDNSSDDEDDGRGEPWFDMLMRRALMLGVNVLVWAVIIVLILFVCDVLPGAMAERPSESSLINTDKPLLTDV